MNKSAHMPVSKRPRAMRVLAVLTALGRGGAAFVPAGPAAAAAVRGAPALLAVRAGEGRSGEGKQGSGEGAASSPRLRSVSFEADVEQTLAASGYKRPSVNWYPGHIAKAERQLSETLRSVDVVVEVRDARAPKATAHPRVAEWAAGRPRVVVLTHVDSVPEAAVGGWRRSFAFFGAGRWDGDVDGQATNRAVQALAERSRFAAPASGGGGSPGSGRIVDRSATSRVEDVLFVDAKRGGGIHSITRSVLRAGAHVNERRARRGLSSRPLRVGIIGYPNVGKSALINKMLGRRRAKTADTPGVTRTLQWIRVRADDAKTKKGREFELLDSPGIIPANMLDQSDALLLAACNSIGTAAYDNQGVASYLFEWLKTLHLMGRGDHAAPRFRVECLKRYGFDPLVPPASGSGDGDEASDPAPSPDPGRLLTGEDMLFRVANSKCRGSPEDAARMMLQDFRSGRLGPIGLQLAPESGDDDGQVKVDVRRGVTSLGGIEDETAGSEEEIERAAAERRGERARVAVETARQRGLQLPPMVEARTGRNEEEEAGENIVAGVFEVNSESAAAKVDDNDVGKGLFDGW